MCLVAVVTPVYNGAKYLAAAMDSVQAQDYPDIVHVVLDNASTDDTPHIIDQYRNRRVKVLAFRNETVLPLPQNWDRAFSFIPRDATYAKLLCADDLIRADCIRRFVDIAQSDLEIETVSCYDVHSDLIRRANIPENVSVLDGREAARAILDRSINWLPYQHLFVRMRAEDYGDRYFGTGNLGCDAHVVARAALRGKLAYVREPLVYTRCHSETISNTVAVDGETPLYAMQINSYLMTFYRAFLAFGPRAWTPTCYAIAKKFWDLDIVRTILWWRVSGFRLAAEELERSALSVGLETGLIDSIVSVLLYPSYKIWKHRWGTRLGPAVSESAFRTSLSNERSVAEWTSVDRAGAFSLEKADPGMRGW